LNRVQKETHEELAKGRNYPVWVREIRRDQHYVKGKNKVLGMSLEKFSPEVEAQNATG